MSDPKKLNKRLSDLFADLEKDITPLPEDSHTLPGWTWMADAQGKYTHCSPEIEEILGCKAADFIGESLTTFRLVPGVRTYVAASLEAKHAQSELTLQFLDADDNAVNVRMYVFFSPADDGSEEHWRGFTQIIEGEITQPKPSSIPEASTATGTVSISTLSIPDGVAIEGDQIYSVSSPHSPIGSQSLESRKTVAHEASENHPAELAVPVELQDQALGLLEFIDENPDRRWSLEEQRLVEEVADQLSLALENAQLFQTEQRRAREMAMLHEVTLDIAQQQLALDSVLDIMTQRAMQLLDSDGGGVWLWREEDQELELVITYQVVDHDITGRRLKSGEGLTGKAFVERRLQTIDNYYNWPDRSLAFEDVPFHSGLSAPMIAQNQVLGALVLSRSQPNRPYTGNEQNLAQLLANQASAMILNATLFEESQKRSEELALINRVVSQVAASLDVNESLQAVTGELANALDVQVNIALVNPDEVSLTMVTDYSPRQENPLVVGYEIPIKGNPSTERVFETKKPIIIEDPQTNPLIASIHDLMRSLDVQNMGIFPLILQDEIFGTVGIYILDEGRVLSQTEIQLVETILVQAATAVQKARLFEQVQTRSTQLQTAAEISRAASSFLEPNPLIIQAVNLIRDRFDLYYAGIFLTDEDGSLTGEAGKWAVLRAGTGEAGNIQVEQGHKLEIGGSSMVGQAISTNQARISLLALDEEQRFVNPLLPETQSEMALPLISRGKVIGAMTIQSTQQGAFSEEDISVLQTMADQVANALQNANLFDQTQQNASELSILNEMSLALSRQIDINEIIQTIYQYTSQLMDTSFFFVSLYDANEEMISFPLVVENNATSQIPSMKKHRGFTQHVIDSKEPLLIRDDVEGVIATLGLEDIIVGESAKSWLGVPMLIGDEVLGVIATQNANHPRVFDTHHQDLLVLVARQSAIALQNAQLFAQTQDHLADLSTIQETTAGLSAALTLSGVVNTLLAYMTSAIQADSASVFTIDEDNLIRIGVFPSGVEAPEIGEILNLSEYPLTQRAINSQEPFAVSADDNLLQEHAQEAFKAAGIAANATIPIVGPEGVLGTISVSRNHPAEVFDENDLNLMATLANQAAVAILNARSYERVQEVAEEMSLLFDVSRALSSGPLEVVDIATTVARNFVDVMQIPECSISLYDPTTNSLEVIVDLVSQDQQEKIIREEQIGMVHSLSDFPATKQVMQTLQPLVIHASDPDADPAELAYMREFETTTMVILPLAIKGQAIGVLELESWDEERNYSQSEINLALTLANQAAVALDNARLYEEQRQITEQLRELDQLKSQFLANMSHELRTPLNSIIGFSRVIMKGIDGPVTEQQQQDLSAIYNAGQHLLNMINDILDISKIEAGKMELAFEDIEVSQIIESVLSTTRGLIKDKPVDLRTDIPEALPFIHADPTRIRQILLNLLSNAAKFTDEGSITVAAKEQVGANGRPEIYIGVIDTGVGIAEEDQQDLFEPFTQVDGSATRKTGGTGLGLSITRLLVDLHDGDIGIDSTPGEGSTFFFTIPILPEEKEKVFAIDGDPQVTELYQRYLADTNFQIISVLLPNEAVKMARELRPFAITLDTNLPDHDGWEIFNALRQDPDTKDIPIMICSLQDVSEKAKNAGAVDYLPKPILKDDLVNALSRIQIDEE